MKFYKFIYCLFFIVALSVIDVSGQAYTFHHLKTDNGLSNSYVKSILKDNHGFLWIATEAGLNRYDGYEFRVYTSQAGNKSSIAFDNIYGLQEDGLGNIWVEGRETYTVYNSNNDSFNNKPQLLLKALGIDVDTTNTVYVDKARNLYVLNAPYLYFYNTSAKKLKKFTVGPAATSAIGDDDDNIYICQNTGQIEKINKYSGNQTILKLPDFIQKEIPNRDYSIYIDSHSGIFLYTGSSDVAYYLKNTIAGWHKLHLNSSLNAKSNIVLDVIDDGNGNLWIGTDHRGLFIFNTNDNSIVNITHNKNSNISISANNITSLYKDDNGTIWMGHNKKGLSFYDNSFHNLVNVDTGNAKDISIIIEDHNGNIWLGTDGNGLYIANTLTGGTIKKMDMPNIAIVSLEEDYKGRIWIGTYLNGLFCYENGSFKQYTKSNSSLISNDIWSLKEDRYGNLWIGTLGFGLQYLKHDDTGFNPILLPGKGLEYCMEMYYDEGDNLYVGTTTGLYLVDISSKKYKSCTGNKKGTQKFKQVTISNIYKDDNENLWLGHPKGMTVWDQKKDTLYYIDKDKGLSDNAIRGIIEDNHNQIWVTTSNGMSVLTTERDKKGIIRFSSRNFSTKDGLPDNYFNNHALCRLRNGDILMGGTEGYTIVNPNKMAEKNEPLARVLFTGLSLGNKKILIDSVYGGRKLLEKPLWQTPSITLKHNDKLLSVEFTTGDLINADKVKYAYKLKGFNNQWVILTANNVMFSSLAPGNYVLEVKASNSDGIWNNNSSSLEIIVTPPFYLSVWAIALYVIIALAIPIVFFIRTKRHHHKKLEKQKLQLEREQEKNLNEMKLKFFTNISHDLRTPLTLIDIPLQNILRQELPDGLRHKLSIINKNVGQLMELINSLLDFRKLDVGAEHLNRKSGDFVHFIKEKCLLFNTYATDRSISFSFSSQAETLPMQFDPVKVEKILYNLLSNAFKYTPNGGSVSVSITIENETVFMSISDTGSGIKEEDKKNIFKLFYQAIQNKEYTGSGIGLHIVNEYVVMHGGSIEVSDNIPSGSIFTIKLPVQEADAEEMVSKTGFKPTFLSEVSPGIDYNKKAKENPVLLIVDDNKDFCEFIAGSLSDEYTMLMANNGFEAIEKLNNTTIDLVISDVMMPKMDGMELCRRIKTNIEWSHIPVLLLTARTAEEYKIEGLEIGADDYLTKPFNFDVLKLRISKFLEWTQRSHSSFSQKVNVSPAEITITSLDEHLIEKAIKIVEENIHDTDFSVEQLGTAVGLSRSHLYKKLMFITGKSPSEFIRTIRLKRGRELLEKSQLQIAEIAYKVGFNSPKRFTINFKNEFGVSPSDYLRNNKQK
ncbi:hybrid sensor histidine kinase/response regulator [Flavobacterium rhizosphaerae]|uniref:histidine kinase n=1 Tax=Flavobacterium rhizosphaerae TaxID=3163298 RepID=A0ABW8YTD3_9FLAO